MKCKYQMNILITNRMGYDQEFCPPPSWKLYAQCLQTPKLPSARYRKKQRWVIPQSLVCWMPEEGIDDDCDSRKFMEGWARSEYFGIDQYSVLQKIPFRGFAKIVGPAGFGPATKRLWVTFPLSSVIIDVKSISMQWIPGWMCSKIIIPKLLDKMLH